MKNKYKFKIWMHFAHKYKTSGDICKTSCWLTEDFNGWGKLINVVSFQGVIEVLLMSGGNLRNLQF